MFFLKLATSKIQYMFPTISHLIRYFTGINISLPIPTFGFFMIIAFSGSYLAFSEEFKRKEKKGIIFPFTQTITIGKPLSIFSLLLKGAGAFLIGYKLTYCFINYHLFFLNPQSILFSYYGNIKGGLVTGVIYIYINYMKIKRHELAVPVKRIKTIHPYQNMDKLLFWCGLYGFIGAILLCKMERLDELIKKPIQFFLTFNGLAFYGGLIFGTVTYLYITKRMGIALSNALDIGSPGMMLAYGIGRMGCHLSGDGDWGIINMAPKPHWLNWLPSWMWAFNYPHNVIHQGRYIPGCTDNYCNELVNPVFPTSFYESIICLLLFFLLWSIRRKIKIPGVMFSIFAILNGMERFLIEKIKINARYSLLDLHFSQAEFIATLICLIGITTLFLSLTANKRRLAGTYNNN